MVQHVFWPARFATGRHGSATSTSPGPRGSFWLLRNPLLFVRACSTILLCAELLYLEVAVFHACLDSPPASHTSSRSSGVSNLNSWGVLCSGGSTTRAILLVLWSLARQQHTTSLLTDHTSMTSLFRWDWCRLGAAIRFSHHADARTSELLSDEPTEVE